MAVENPGTVIEDISKGKFNKRAVDIVKRLYGDAWAAMQNEVRADVERATAADVKFTVEQKRALARLLDEPTLKPAIDNPRLFAKLQGNFEGEKEDKPGPRMSRTIPNLAMQEQTRLQKALEGRT